MNFGMLRGISKSHLEMPSFCHPGARCAIGSILLVIALCLVACGDDSGTSVNDLSSSSFVIPDSVPGSVSSSSKKVSSSSRVNSAGSSSVSKSSSSSSAKKTSSSSVYVEACSEEGHFIQRTKFPTKEKEWYICENGYYVLYVQSSSSQRVLTFKESFKKDSVFNDEIEYGTFKDPRDGQEYKTVVIKISYVNLPEFEVFAQNLNYGTQINLGTAEFDDKKVEKFCLYDDPWYCDNYIGGLYSWSEAMGLPKACDSVWTGATPECPDSVATGIVFDSDWDYLQIQGVCPEGWHVMNRMEWQAMIGSHEGIGFLLSRASDGSNLNGFSAVFAGNLFCNEDSCKYTSISSHGYFWFPKETENVGATCMDLNKQLFTYKRAFRKNTGNSIRCVKDYKEED